MTAATSPWAAPHFAGIAERKFLIPQCDSCAEVHFPPRRFCPHCWSETYSWVPASGDGVIYSVSEVRAYPPTSFEDQLPFTIAIVRLSEGISVLTNIVTDGDSASIDQQVRLDFHEVHGEVLPCFRPVAGAP